MLLEWWSCTECTLFTDQATMNHFGKEHVVVILNHNFEIDFLCGWTMCERFGVLGVSELPEPGSGLSPGRQPRPCPGVGWGSDGLRAPSCISVAWPHRSFHP